MIVRLLLLAAILGVAWYLYRRLIKPAAGNDQTSAQQPSAQATMNRCAECGVHAPEDSGVRYQQLFFCCPEHMNSHIRKNSSS